MRQHLDIICTSQITSNVMHFKAVVWCIQNAIVLRRQGRRVLKGRDVGRKHGKHIEAKPLTQFGGYVERSIRTNITDIIHCKLTR
jgi:hypothetical protein